MEFVSTAPISQLSRFCSFAGADFILDIFGGIIILIVYVQCWIFENGADMELPVFPFCFFCAILQNGQR